MAICLSVCSNANKQTKTFGQIPKTLGPTFLVIRTSALTLLCSLHLRFWNQTRMTREFKPVISVNCSCGWWILLLNLDLIVFWERGCKQMLLWCNPLLDKRPLGSFLPLFALLLQFDCLAATAKVFWFNLFSQKFDLIQSFQLSCFPAFWRLS